MSSCRRQPENVLIAGSPRLKSRVMLCDFGLCARMKPGQFKLSDFVGSPGFFAPEVLTDEPYDGRKIDVWSLGCVLLEMLLGHQVRCRAARALAGALLNEPHLWFVLSLVFFGNALPVRSGVAFTAHARGVSLDGVAPTCRRGRRQPFHDLWVRLYQEKDFGDGSKFRRRIMGAVTKADPILFEHTGRSEALRTVLVHGMLTTDEDDRLSAEELCGSPWLAHGGPAAAAPSVAAAAAATKATMAAAGVSPAPSSTSRLSIDSDCDNGIASVSAAPKSWYSNGCGAPANGGSGGAAAPPGETLDARMARITPKNGGSAADSSPSQNGGPPGAFFGDENGGSSGATPKSGRGQSVFMTPGGSQRESLTLPRSVV